MQINVLIWKYPPQYPQNERTSSTDPEIIRTMPIPCKHSNIEKPWIPPVELPVSDANEFRLVCIVSSISVNSPMSDDVYTITPPTIKSTLII